MGRWQSTLAPLLLLACSESTDTLGFEGFRFEPLVAPPSYPNAFLEIDKSEREISRKVTDTFESLFHGNASSRAIYVELDEERAYIEDKLHSDVRTEGMGLGMMITVQLDKQEEFDKLWRYARTELRYEDAPRTGYFRSSCSQVESPDRWSECADPYGHQHMLMALVFAANRWGRTSGELDYMNDAKDLLDVMREQEARNGGIVDGVTNMFDEDKKLVFDRPDEASAGVTRPSIEMPAYYELFAQATGDPFYAEAALRARELWKLAAHEETGLMPVRATFDGAPVPRGSTSGSAGYQPEAYRAQLNMAIDRIWFDKDPAEVEICDKVLAFFRGLNSIGRSYTLAGSVTDTGWEPALTPVNGATALCGTLEDNLDFVQAAWDAVFLNNIAFPNGAPRYYHGVMHLTALLILSGQFRVY